MADLITLGVLQIGRESRNRSSYCNVCICWQLSSPCCGLRSHLIFRSLRESCCVANRQTILSHCEPVQASVVLWAIYYMRFRVVLSVQSRLCFKPHSKTPLSKIIAIDCVQFKESLKYRYAWTGLVSHKIDYMFLVLQKKS